MLDVRSEIHVSLIVTGCVVAVLQRRAPVDRCRNRDRNRCRNYTRRGLVVKIDYDYDNDYDCALPLLSPSHGGRRLLPTNGRAGRRAVRMKRTLQGPFVDAARSGVRALPPHASQRDKAKCAPYRSGQMVVKGNVLTDRPYRGPPLPARPYFFPPVAARAFLIAVSSAASASAPRTTAAL